MPNGRAPAAPETFQHSGPGQRRITPPITSWTCSMIFISAPVQDDVVVHTTLNTQAAMEAAESFA